MEGLETEPLDDRKIIGKPLDYKQLAEIGNTGKRWIINSSIEGKYRAKKPYSKNIELVIIIIIGIIVVVEIALET